MKSMSKAYMNWSSGKDATMALCAIQEEGEYNVDRLLTTVNSSFKRVSMHGLHESLLIAQSEAIGVPLDILYLDENMTMDRYNELMTEKLNSLVAEGYKHTVFGDIFLEDLRKYREDMLQQVGITGIFPLWKKDTKSLLEYFIQTGFKAIVVCCNAQNLSESFCGRLIDEQFIEDLPEGVDPCGENGEFHTFCFDGPCFKKSINFRKGDVVYKTYPAPSSSEEKEYGFWFCDLILNP